MRDKFIVGNWKMYGNKHSVTKLLHDLKAYDRKVTSKVKLVVCPSYVFLDQTQVLLQKTRLQWAAQNMAAEKKGPYTGEISATMLLEFACRYVLLGHSERRTLYGETDQEIAKKFKLATSLGLVPILCVGETLAQRRAEQTQSVLQGQLERVFDFGAAVLEQGIIAYEPVWAIGTGLSAQPEQAQEVHRFLRQQAKLLDPDLAQKLPILYGGSVKSDNAKPLFQMPDIDGGLIGGASLDAVEFLDIYGILASMAACAV